MMKKRKTRREGKAPSRKRIEIAIACVLFAAAAILLLSKLDIPCPIGGAPAVQRPPAASEEAVAVDFVHMSSMDRAAIRKTLGRPKNITTKRRPFYEQSIEWSYDGLKIKIFAFNNPIGRDTEQVYQIDITGDKYATKDGIRIGMPREKVAEVLGGARYNTLESVMYILSPSGSPAVKYYFEHGAVSRILYFDEEYFDQKEKDELP